MPRSSEGKFVAARAINLGMVGSALYAEVLAWRNAMEFGIFLGLDDCIFEGDSQVTVKILWEEMVCLSKVEVIIEDIWKMAHQFRSCVFWFVRRFANAVSNKLARVGLGGSRTRT